MHSRMAFKQGSTKSKGIFSHLTKTFSTQQKLVDVSINEKTGVSTITLNRPPVNCINLQLVTELKQVLSDTATNKARGVILTSGLATVFSAGLDITEIYQPETARLNEFYSLLQDCWLLYYGFQAPTVSVINGHSPAGGCLLALCSEYRIMLPEFTIGLNETQVGIVAPTWLQGTLRNTMGPRAAELALTTGRLFTTQQALSAGLVDEIACSKTDAVSKAEQFLNGFARIPSAARNLTKVSFRAQSIKALEKDRDADLKTFVEIVSRPQIQEDINNYMETLKKNKTTR